MPLAVLPRLSVAQSCAGACTPTTSCTLLLATGQNKPRGLTSDERNLYWATGDYAIDGAGTISMAPIAGGDTRVLASGLNGPVGVAVSATDVYWTMLWSTAFPTRCEVLGFVQYSLMKAPIAGGPFVEVACGSDWSGPAAITREGSNLYWAVDLFGNDYTSGRIMSEPVGGSVATTLAQGGFSPVGIAADATSVYWTSSGVCQRYDASILCSSGKVLKAPLGGGDTVTLASGLAASATSGPNAVAVDPSTASVYWTNSADNSVMRVSVAGGAPVRLASDQPGPAGIAADSSAASVYWVNTISGTIMKWSSPGASPTVVASRQNQPTSITLDATSIYWSNEGDGTIMRLLKDGASR